MKKIISLLCLMAIMLSMSLTALAGSIPEDLLQDESQIFFAEIVYTHLDKEKPDIEFSPVKKIKGDVKLGTKQIAYNFNTVGDFDIIEGNVYLFTYFDENNPTDIFEVTSYDTSTLKLKNVEGDMWERFEKYLNEGKYEKAEQNRINEINSRLTEVGDETTLAALTETDNGNCYKVEMSLFGQSEVYEIDKSKFYRLAENIRLVDVENVLAMDTDNALIISCYEDVEPCVITIWDNCTVAGSRVAMYSAPTGDYIIKAEDFNELLSLLPEEAQPKLPPLKSLYANFMYWFIFNSTTAYVIGTVILVALVGVIVLIAKHKRKKKGTSK